jgi:hypothetical protein
MELLIVTKPALLLRASNNVMVLTITRPSTRLLNLQRPTHPSYSPQFQLATQVA